MSFPASKSNQKNLRKTRRDGKNLKGFKPQITSLVDVMTILLIYLLQSFSSEGDIMPSNKDLILPESSAQKTPKLTVNVMVNQKTITADGVVVASVDEVLASDDMVIPELSAWLAERRAMTEKISQYSDKTKFTGELTVQGDKRIRFRLLKKIMYTGGQEGFNNFFLAVQKRE